MISAHDQLDESGGVLPPEMARELGRFGFGGLSLGRTARQPHRTAGFWHDSPPHFGTIPPRQEFGGLAFWAGKCGSNRLIDAGFAV